MYSDVRLFWIYVQRDLIRLDVFPCVKCSETPETGCSELTSLSYSFILTTDNVCSMSRNCGSIEIDRDCITAFYISGVI